MGFYAYLRSGYDYYAGTHDGRLGYSKDRSDLRVWTKQGALSRLWKIDDFGRIDDSQPSVHKWSLEAVDTAVPPMPPNPDWYALWAHNPLVLSGEPGVAVGLGPRSRDTPDAALAWAAEEYQVQNPRNPAPEQITIYRLRSLAAPGWYLCHTRDQYNIPQENGPISWATTPDPNEGGTPGQDLWWYLEPQPAPGAQALEAKAAEPA